EHERIKQYMLALPLAPGRGSLIGRTALEGRPVQIADALADPEYAFPEVQKLGRYRTMLGVPLLREGVPIGVIALQRTEVRPFTGKADGAGADFGRPGGGGDREGTAFGGRAGTPASSPSPCRSRPPPPMSSRSSAARRLILNQCCRRSSSQLPGFAKPIRPR